MVNSYRIVKRKFQETAFTGKGAAIAGGRWNSLGTRLVYTSQTQSLATLETLVHIDDTSILPYYVMLEINIPDDSILHLDDEDLPEDWQSKPPPTSTVIIGDLWKNSHESLALSVPSTILPNGERNILINPDHKKAKKIFDDAVLIDFMFDERFIK